MSDDKVESILLAEIRLNRKAIEKLNDRQTKSEIRSAKMSSLFGAISATIITIISKYFH